MTRFEIERRDARRMLLNRLLEIEEVSDREIEQYLRTQAGKGLTETEALLKLSKMSRAERGFRLQEGIETKGADAHGGT